MPNTLAVPAFEGFEPALVAHAERADALERFLTTPSGHEKPSRYWKHDIEAVSVEGLSISSTHGSVTIGATHPRVIACDLVAAARNHAGLLARGFGNAVERRNKFAHLTRAYAQLGAFIYVPAECSVDEPIRINYGAAAGTAIFPYTVVVLERGARATILERIEPGSGAFVCGVSEIVTAESSQITYACIQRAPDDARVFFTRAALPGRDATAEWAIAELGAALSVGEVTISITNPGVDAHIASLFFPIGSQHVDLVTTADHLAGESTSGTLVKSAANGAGQGRYLGNIRIAKDAQQTVANLRDDAFLLSQRAHIDSIPALEIAANDVKAYHGATIGAMDDEQLFYMTSRGIDRSSAERMIALGFFEPVIDRFPGEALRNELRTALEEKVSP